MAILGRRLTVPGAWALLLVACTTPSSKTPTVDQRSTRYQDLVALFSEWRSVQRPKVVNGAPDYRPAAMEAQRRDLAAIQRKLAAIDPTGWPAAQQVDYHLTRAEMNGLDFDHRVLEPWARNPAFYVTVFPEQSDQPAREGPVALGAIELWSYQFPLGPQDAGEIGTGLAAIPELLAQARGNLTGNAKDLWVYGTRSLKQQSVDLQDLKTKVADHPELLTRIDAATRATDSLVGWLESQAATKTEPSGIGIANYDWYLKNVQLVPYTWQDEVTLMERELARAKAFLALEEIRNRRLPEPVPIGSEAEHARRFGPAVSEYMAFLEDHDILTIEDYLEPALQAKVGRFAPGPREFFTEVDYRDPMVMRTHGFHWFDLAHQAKNPPISPIRKGPLLYNIFNTRTEGWATGWEEMMLMAGMFDQRPRSRELIYVLVGQRAARALGDLMMHANRFTLEQAVDFASSNTPRGWLRKTGATVWGEQHLYLQQPGYGTSYLIGKIEGEKLLAARRAELGESFSMHRFMDEFLASGLVPTSMIRWELAGQPEDIRRMLTP